jgi:hypothetical protein
VHHATKSIPIQPNTRAATELTPFSEEAAPVWVGAADCTEFVVLPTVDVVDVDVEDEDVVEDLVDEEEGEEEGEALEEGDVDASPIGPIGISVGVSVGVGGDVTPCPGAVVEVASIGPGVAVAVDESVPVMVTLGTGKVGTLIEVKPGVQRWFVTPQTYPT